MGKDALDIIKDVTLNVATGGMYSLGKSLVDTVKTGDPSHLLTQGLDIGMAATGNNLAEHLGGKNAAMAFNAAGGVAGLAGGIASGAGIGAGGFGTATETAAEGVAPTVLEGATGTTGVTPIAEGSSGEAIANPNFTQAAGAKPGIGEFPATSMPGQEGATLPGESGWAAKPAGSGLLATPSGTPTSGLNAMQEAEAAQAAEKLKMGVDPKTVATGMSPEVKSALMMGGTLAAGQMFTGALGGIFQGVSAQKQLELQQLINQQNQNQRLYYNKNNSYSPKLSFKQPTGVLTTPA